MTFYRVQVEITADVWYPIEADTETEARQTALDMADDGVRFDDMNVSDRRVVDVADKTAEHEGRGMKRRDGLIVRAVEIAAGRLASGDVTKSVIENVKVSCRRCGGVTVFPVLKDGGVRQTPAPCFHCGADV